jgi:hypothetical protein
MPINAGGSYLGSPPVALVCVVAPNGTNSFQVNVAVHEGQLYGVTLGGTITNTAGPQKIEGSFNQLNVGEYTQDDCMFTLNPTSTQDDPAIAAGRIWGSISCPTITDSNNSPPNVCDAQGTIILQNCSQ